MMISQRVHCLPAVRHSLMHTGQEIGGNVFGNGLDCRERAALQKAQLLLFICGYMKAAHDLTDDKCLQKLTHPLNCYAALHVN